MLAKNALLEEIVDKLSRHQPSLSTPLSKMQRLLPSGYRTVIHTLRGLLAEQIVQHGLEEVCREYGTRVIFPEIPEGAETKHFQFSHGDFGRLVCYKKETGNIHGDYDCLLVADELPVLVEVKLIHSDRSKGSMSRKSGFGTNGLRVVLGDGYIEHILKPLQEYFSTEKIGYVIVALPTRINDSSERQNHFREQGGFLVPFYASREHYHKKTLPLLQPWVKEFPHHSPLPPDLPQEEIETLLVKPLADELLRNWFLSPLETPLPEVALLAGRNLTVGNIHNYIFRRHVIHNLGLGRSNGCWQKQDDPKGEHGEFSFVPNPWEGTVIYGRGRNGKLTTLSGLYYFTHQECTVPVAVDCTPAFKSRSGRVKAAVRALTGQEPYLLRCLEALPEQKPGFYPEQDGTSTYCGKILLPRHEGIQRAAQRVYASLCLKSSPEMV